MGSSPGWFLRPSTGPRFPQGRELAELSRPELPRHGTPALVPDRLARRLACLADEIAGEGDRGAQQLAGAAGSVLGKPGTGFEDEVHFGEDDFEGVQRRSIGWHASIVRPLGRESKWPPIFRQRKFQTLRSHPPGGTPVVSTSCGHDFGCQVANAPVIQQNLGSACPAPVTISAPASGDLSDPLEVVDSAVGPGDSSEVTSVPDPVQYYEAPMSTDLILAGGGGGYTPGQHFAGEEHSEDYDD
jgi:hypothetical protein